MVLQFDGYLVKNEDHLYKYHILVPPDIVDVLRRQKIKRFLVSLQGGETFHAGLIPAGDQRYFIKINQSLRKKHHLEVGSQCHVQLTQDDSKYGIPIADEMQELLDQDSEGRVLFHALTPGKQRSLLYLINRYKTSDMRLDKAIIILQHLKTNRGSLDFKLLHQDLLL